LVETDYHIKLRRLRAITYTTGALIVLALAALTMIPSSIGAGPEPTDGDLHTALTGRAGGNELWERVLRVSSIARPSGRPAAVILAPANDWRSALAATSLICDPLDGVLLITPPDAMPDTLAREIKRLDPRGIAWDGGTQVIVVGDAGVEIFNRLKAMQMRHRHLHSDSPEELAATIDAYLTSLRGEQLPQVSLVPTDDPASAVVAADWAAHSGTPILFAEADSLPVPTMEALSGRKPGAHVRIFFPAGVLRDEIREELSAYGTVDGPSGADPVELAVASAQHHSADAAGNPCGWGITTPGRGFTFSLLGHPLDAVLAANLTRRGAHGPLLQLLPDSVPEPVAHYLDTLRPAPTPIAGERLNQGWIVGSESDIDGNVQQMIDELLAGKREETQ